MLTQSVRRALVVSLEYSAPTGSQAFNDSGIIGNMLARALRCLRSKQMADHVRFYRDFYANAKSPEHVRGIAGTVLAPHGLQIGEIIDAQTFAARQAELSQQFDAVVLLHPDALGLGHAALERKARRAFGDCVFIVNGRGRCYRLDPAMKRALRRHRLLAETRLIEAVLVTIIRIAGPLLSLYDWLAYARRR